MEQSLIVVNEDDKVLEYAPRSVCHTGQGRMHRAVLAVLYNAQGKLLLQQRKHHLFDNQWDLTGATHPLHADGKNESYEEATARLLKVEWGVVAPAKKVLPFVYFAQEGASCENELCYLLAGRFDSQVAARAEHAYGLRWASVDECMAELRDGKAQYTPWARVALEKLTTDPRGRDLLATLRK